MPKISVNILTKNRSEFLRKTLETIFKQNTTKDFWSGNKNVIDFEVIIVNDGSKDDTKKVIFEFQKLHKNLFSIHHSKSLGITYSRQECLLASRGEYIAILDDDDNWGFWADRNKLSRQASFLDLNPNYVLVGGFIQIGENNKFHRILTRPSSNWLIKLTMLFRNNFFTSTVMFRKSAAIKAGGFIQDGVDLAEDYDLWLRIGHLGKMYNFKKEHSLLGETPFVYYRKPSYNKEKIIEFYKKQLFLIKREKKYYPGFLLASFLLKLRIWLIKLKSI